MCLFNIPPSKHRASRGQDGRPISLNSLIHKESSSSPADFKNRTQSQSQKVEMHVKVDNQISFQDGAE